MQVNLGKDEVVFSEKVSDVSGQFEESEKVILGKCVHNMLYTHFRWAVLGEYMKSKVVTVSPFVKKIRRVFDTFHDDRVSVYAAQTAFYICISAIPFVVLLILFLRLVSPELVPEMSLVLKETLPAQASEVLDFVFAQAYKGADIPIVSTAAFAALWSASRGMRAVMRGVSEVYRVEMKGTFIYSVLRSVIYTAVFVGILTVTILFFIFGSISPVSEHFYKIGRLLRFKAVFFTLFLGLYFSLIFYAVAKGTLFFGLRKKVSSECPKKYKDQLPGALFAAGGWVLFSFFYSLYIRYFPRSSYIYGSLGAVVFLMLWLYFCIFIILTGAEINKAIYLKRKNKKYRR